MPSGEVLLTNVMGHSGKNRQEPVQEEGLNEVLVKLSLRRLIQVLAVPVTSDGDEGLADKLRQRSKLVCHAKAAENGHTEVQDKNIWVEREGYLDGLIAVVSDLHLEPLPSQQQCE